MKQKLGLISLLIFTSLLCIIISGCSSLEKIADDKINSVNKDKYIFNLNKKDGTQIYCDENCYQILETNVEKAELDENIGSINQIAVLDKNNNIVEEIDIKNPLSFMDSVDKITDKEQVMVPFKSIYSIKACDSTKVIAVEINEKYYKAEVKE